MHSVADGAVLKSHCNGVNFSFPVETVVSEPAISIRNT